MYCDNCGRESAVGARFCVGCGKELATPLPPLPSPPVNQQALVRAEPSAVVAAQAFPTPVFPSPVGPASGSAPHSSGRRGSGSGYPRTYAEGKSPFLAWFFSFLLVGLGQFYNGDIKKGLLMLVGAVVGILVTFGIASFVFWIWSMIDAYRVASRSIPLWT